MRVKLGLILVVIGLLQQLYAVVDSTDLIFNDAEVHRYELKYYVANWIDSMEFNKVDNDEAYMAARFCYKAPNGDSIVLDSIGVRYKGNSSYTIASDNIKKSFKFNFNLYKDQTFFSCTMLNLNNCIEDPSYMREKIGYDIIRKYMATPRAAYATLYVNDTLIGVYAQIEQVDEDFLARHYARAGGSLFKAGDNGAALDYKGSNQIAYDSIYEIKENKKDDNAWTHLITMLYKLNDTLAGSAGVVAATQNHLNFTNAIQHFAWTMVLSHFDSYTGTGRNYYLYDNPESGKFDFIPWDVNMAFGQLPYQWDVITNNAFQLDNLDIRPLNRTILADENLRNEYIYWLRDMINGPASAENVAKEADRLKAIIEPFVKIEPDSNRFFPYDEFIRNIDEDLVKRIGFSQTVIPGIKSFSVARNAELLRQIAAGVAYHPETVRKNVNSAVRSTMNNEAALLHIEYTLPGTDMNVKLVDSRGRVALQHSFTRVSGRGSLALSVASLPSGVYIVSVSTGTKTLSNRIMVAR